MDSFFLAFFSSLLSLLPLPASSDVPVTHFLACGAASNVYFPADNPPRTFLPDSSFTFKSSVSLTNPSPSSSPLSATARVFPEGGTYHFPVNSPGTLVLRLHFFPFSSSGYNLSAARFNISALSRFLLSDFFVVDATIKEFFLWVNSGDLDVIFSPRAFVNAIEVFNTPNNFNNTIGMNPQALELVYRINVGGPKVTPANDTLWRTWLPDDDYILQPSLSLENKTSLSSVTYPEDGSVTDKIAPQNVYNTARTMNITDDMRTSNPSFNFNVTWSFRVTTGYRYLVRLHFCDFISKAEGNSFLFNAFVGEVEMANLHSNNPAEPFYHDFSTDVATSGLLNVSIDRSQTSSATDANAILNGLEMWKVNNSFGSLSGSFVPTGNNNNKRKGGVSTAVVASAAAAGLVLVGLVGFASILLLKKKRRSKLQSRKPTEVEAVSWSPYQGTSNSGAGLSSKTVGPSAYPRLNLALHIPFIEIKAATNDFDEQLIVGSGGFGKVYRGVLSDGTKVAVKRGSIGSKQGYPEFQTEIIVLSQIRHRHLVSLIGYCEEKSERILVYEYMEKGTLRNHLYGSPDKPCLSWKQRLEICIGAARGLHYLHTGYSHIIIHRDVKSTNILLDEEYLAKVSDFGLSKLGPSYGETHVTTGVKGTIGYLDPEYFKTQKLTDKSDVYSFGVMLLEVLCARPVIEQGMARDQLNLAEWAMQWQRKGQLERIIDARLAGKISRNSLMKFGETAEKCLADYGIDRPTFADILWNLEYALRLQETEVRREPYEDSGNVDLQIPTVEASRMPSSGGDASVISTREFSTTESSVFSQLIVGEGR